MTAFVSASNVREYANITGATGQWTEANLASNIRAASSFLEKRTGRQFALQTGTTKKFTTNGNAYISLPGARGNSPTITLAGSSLTLDTDAFLIPDTQQSGVYIGLQFRAFGRRGGYRSYPDWFDTNKDSWRWAGNWGGSDPNDLSITDDWGYPPDEYPEELLLVTKVLSVFFTERPDAKFGAIITTPAGNEVDVSQYPVEVQDFIRAWRISPESSVASVG